MSRTTVIESGEANERELANEQGDVAEYVREREKFEDSDILQGLRELDGASGIRWEVHRQGDMDQSRNGWVCDIPVEQLTIQHLSNLVGPGVYRVIGKHSNGRIATQRTVRIAGDARRWQQQNLQGGTTAGMGGSLNIEEWERRQELKDEKRRRERNELLALMIPALSPIVAAIVGRNGPDVTGLVAALKPPDPMTMIAALKQLSPQVEQNQPTAIESAFKIIDRLKDLSPGEGGTSWLDVFKELARSAGPTLGTMIEGAVVRAQSTSPASATAPLTAPGAVPSVVSLPAPAADGASQTGGANPMFGMLALIPWLKTQLEMCLQKAARGSDPGLIAERLIDDLPDGVKPEQLLELIARADWWAQMQRFDPRVAQYGPWFARMREAILEQFNASSGDSAPGNTAKPVIAQNTMTVTEVKPEPDRPSGEAPKLGL